MKTHIETLDENGVRNLLSWAATEGWNPGCDDAAAFFSTDPSGFLMLFVGEEPAAGISVVRYSYTHSFLGLYIARPEFRGRGLGFTLWQHGMNHVEGTTVALDGVVEQQENYQKSGFEFSHRNIRFMGEISLFNPSSFGQLSEVTNEEMPTLVTPDVLPDLIALDESINGMRRERYMASWLTNTATRWSVFHRQDNEIVGFGSIRKCADGFKLGPITAGNVSSAKLMVTSLLNLVVAEADTYSEDNVFSQNITIDVPESNTIAMQWVQEVGLVPVFETARMYRGRAPIADLKRQFGVATLELG